MRSKNRSSLVLKLDSYLTLERLGEALPFVMPTNNGGQVGWCLPAAVRTTLCAFVAPQPLSAVYQAAAVSCWNISAIASGG